MGFVCALKVASTEKEEKGIIDPSQDKAIMRIATCVRMHLFGLFQLCIWGKCHTQHTHPMIITLALRNNPRFNLLTTAKKKRLHIC